MQRGFKAWCENVSLQVRAELGLDHLAPLPYQTMADFLSVPLWSPDEIAGLSDEAKQVLRRESDNWSAVTVSSHGRDAVIFNPGHTGGRRSSDVMHELAHLFIGHKPATVIMASDKRLALRSFDRDQEEEANWLAWCLLVPRPAVLQIVSSRLGERDACDRYAISLNVLHFRTNVTGATRQLRPRAADAATRRATRS